MPYTYTFLKFDSEAEWLALGWQDTPDCVSDIVAPRMVGGTLNEETGVYEGGTLSTDFCVNIAHKGPLPDVLSPFVIPTPQHPRQRFA